MDIDAKLTTKDLDENLALEPSSMMDFELGNILPAQRSTQLTAGTAHFEP
jgi:hypothetical protein